MTVAPDVAGAAGATGGGTGATGAGAAATGAGAEDTGEEVVTAPADTESR